MGYWICVCRVVMLLLDSSMWGIVVVMEVFCSFRRMVFWLILRCWKVLYGMFECCCLFFICS